jgi:hypothetical protein
LKILGFRVFWFRPRNIPGIRDNGMDENLKIGRKKWFIQKVTQKMKTVAKNVLVSIGHGGVIRRTGQQGWCFGRGNGVVPSGMYKAPMVGVTGARFLANGNDNNSVATDVPIKHVHPNPEERRGELNLDAIQNAQDAPLSPGYTENLRAAESDNQGDFFLTPSTISSRGFGVFLDKESDDVNMLVNNFAAPALARALRDRECTLQTAAMLFQSGKKVELEKILRPFLRSSVDRRRKRKHEIDLNDGEFTRKVWL